MFKRTVSVVFLIVFFVASLGIWLSYRAYTERRAERLARLQQQAAEVSATIIEGWTVEQMGEYFEKLGLFSAKDFTAAVENYDSTSFPLTKRPQGASLEGFLFPDTYRFAKTATPQQVIEKMLTNFTSRLASINVGAEAVSADQKFNGLSLYEIITLASIIEKESGGQTGERGLVASVFYNRLAIGQALESDATVNYVTGKDTPAASAQDLQVNSPYNTYKYPGLPPGPICNPSLGSIAAALRPPKSDFYYFLHRQPSGEVEFSRTFEEHKQKKLGR
jgi:UPF0755 protein